jgi:hypothetical protein
MPNGEWRMLNARMANAERYRECQIAKLLTFGIRH